jgi:MoaA/NifB/PqqE/SkfB family radical SAM enzyme
MGTVRKLKEAGIHDLGLACTGSRDNPGALGEVKKLAEEMGVDYVCSVVHSSEVYFGSQEDMVPRDPTTRADLIAYYTDGIIDYIDKRPRREPCVAATRHIYVNHKGVVYPCNILNRPLGDLTRSTWEEIEAAAHVPGVLADVKGCKIQCWMSCTVAPGMKSNPLVPAGWIVKRWLAGATPRREN